MTRHRVALAGALFAATLAFPAAGLGVTGVLNGVSDFHPPDAAGSAVEDFTSPFIGWSFWVDQRGTYTVSSAWISEAFEGRILLYRGPLDPDDPLANLIAVSDYVEGATSFEVLLEAGVIYYVAAVHADADQASIVDLGVTVAGGPAEPRLSACFPPGDDPYGNDVGEALALAGTPAEDFCVFVEYRGHQGGGGLGTTVPYRSADSGLFWFFHPDNWELLVKVLDGCAMNGHYWVFFAATTDVEFDLFVGRESEGLDGGRVYHNDAGHRADAVTDTAAFPCADVP